jgi:hypothetical protein
MREIALTDGVSTIVFDETEDLLLTATFRRCARAFDGLLPATEVRWGEIHIKQGFCAMYGCLVEKNDALDKPHIFVDQRLRDRSLTLFVELVILHEICHFKVSEHDAMFVKEYLRALQRVSWEPLIGKCVPTQIDGLDDSP